MTHSIAECGFRISDLKKDSRQCGSYTPFNPQSEIRIPQSKSALDSAVENCIMRKRSNGITLGRWENGLLSCVGAFLLAPRVSSVTCTFVVRHAVHLCKESRAG